MEKDRLIVIILCVCRWYLVLFHCCFLFYVFGVFASFFDLDFLPDHCKPVPPGEKADFFRDGLSPCRVNRWSLLFDILCALVLPYGLLAGPVFLTGKIIRRRHIDAARRISEGAFVKTDWRLSWLPIIGIAVLVASVTALYFFDPDYEWEIEDEMFAVFAFFFLAAPFFWVQEFFYYKLGKTAQQRHRLSSRMSRIFYGVWRVAMWPLTLAAFFGMVIGLFVAFS